MNTAVSQPFPQVTTIIEDIPVAGLPNPDSLFQRLVYECRRKEQSVVHYLNVHVANMAHQHPRLKRILQQCDLVYCDGAGIVLASKLMGQPLPVRLPAADWFTDLLAVMAQEGLTVYLLGGAPGVAERALAAIAKQVPNHTVVGMHHGYFLNNPQAEAAVIDEINRLQPHLLIVGFGTPLQEEWIDTNRSRLQVSVIYALGAVMDYFAGVQPRCPQWMGDLGFEWLYRLMSSPRRLFHRYVVGNPWFLWRLAMRLTASHTLTLSGRRPLAPSR